MGWKLGAGLDDKLFAEYWAAGCYVGASQPDRLADIERRLSLVEVAGVELAGLHEWRADVDRRLTDLESFIN